MKITGHFINEIITTLYHFYPRNISPWSINYETSLEILNQTLTHKKYEGSKANWEDFLNYISETYPNSFVQDRNYTPSICSCYKVIISFWNMSGNDYTVVFHYSNLMPYHAYYINEKKHKPETVHEEHPPMTDAMLEELYRNPPPPPPFERYWNQSPSAIAPIVDQILEAYPKFLPRLQLFPTELLHYRVLQIGTQRREMHEATIFDLLFTDVWEDA
ncbi:hypothetical protein [Xanthocytophaga agilis]|uniref:Uncharacterized protein n=1 Tax=Xanthocytophaga agilis TaxID=3048010 RepID=A0AAE3R9N4_9BACT|nr:hypothetical protein [Xanthocytophaga agilis]MDJ1505805.1 hypothetical protein [Xanthocytophaga agilis]